MSQEEQSNVHGTSRREEEAFLEQTPLFCNPQ